MVRSISKPTRRASRILSAKAAGRSPTPAPKAPAVSAAPRCRIGACPSGFMTIPMNSRSGPVVRLPSRNARRSRHVAGRRKSQNKRRPQQRERACDEPPGQARKDRAQAQDGRAHAKKDRADDAPGLDHDPMRLNRITVQFPCPSRNLSESRFHLGSCPGACIFGMMLWAGVFAIRSYIHRAARMAFVQSHLIIVLERVE